MDSHPSDITQLLHDWQSGDPDAQSELFERLLPELRRIAARYFRGERANHTLQPTALVSEAFLRLARAHNVNWNDRGHFLAVAARIMRRCLIDHANGRPDAPIVSIDMVPEALLGSRTPLDWAVTIDTLLDELGRESPQRCQAVELKFYLGFSDEEAAAALNLSLRSFQREWFYARRWLFERLAAESCKGTSPTQHIA